MVQSKSVTCVRARAFRSAASAAFRSTLLAALSITTVGCTQMVRDIDRQVAPAIERKQRETLGLLASVDLDDRAGPPRLTADAYRHSPSGISPEVPANFETRIPAADSAAPKNRPNETTPPDKVHGEAQGEPRTSGRATDSPDPRGQTKGSVGGPARVPASADAGTPRFTDGAAAKPDEPQLPRLRDDILTLGDSQAYAQRHKRDYQSAKEDLYLSALALTLKRHLWTPIFSSNLRTVYGNDGEITDFDQAMRFVADVGVSQRLPYGGEFTAEMISTLIRDVKQTITAEEGGQINLSVRVPFLRNAGHIAREDLIQLERELTYAVRDFERFRRRQMVDVATGYFRLLTVKQSVLDTAKSLNRFRDDFERAEAQEQLGVGLNIDMRRAEQAMLSAENNLANEREDFRAESDRFKLLIGMPVDEPIGLGDLPTIDEIEEQVAQGAFSLLVRPAVDDEALAIGIALDSRLDVLNRRDQVDDARRGVAVAKNQLLPDFDLTTSLTYDTAPAHYRVLDFEQARATWRSELILSLPLERTAARNRYRGALIGVRQRQRSHLDLSEAIRADVRTARHRIRLANRTVAIQKRSVDVAELRRDYASYMYNEVGEFSNRDLVEAENDWRAARNALNRAQTERWWTILDFRLATGTLRVAEAPVADERDEDSSGQGLAFERRLGIITTVLDRADATALVAVSTHPP